MPDETIVTNPGTRPVELHHTGTTQVIRPGRETAVPRAPGAAGAHLDELVRRGLLAVVDRPIRTPAAGRGGRRSAAGKATGKSAANKAAAKKTASRKSAARKTAAKKTASHKTAAKKTGAKSASSPTKSSTAAPVAKTATRARPPTTRSANPSGGS